MQISIKKILIAILIVILLSKLKLIVEFFRGVFDIFNNALDPEEFTAFRQICRSVTFFSVNLYNYF